MQLPYSFSGADGVGWAGAPDDLRVSCLIVRSSFSVTVDSFRWATAIDESAFGRRRC